MQYLVAVGVADAAEESRIGERALERMVFALQPLAKRFESGVLQLEPAHVEAGERRFALHEVKRGTLLRSRLGERECTGGKLEQREGESRRRLLTTREPAQPPGDHEVEHEKELVLEREHDALAHPAHAAHALSLG